MLNKPKKRSTYLSADLTQFVRQHKCRRWETLASVAVQHGSDVVALRRLNNLMSDNALRSRVLVYVPGAGRIQRMSPRSCSCCAKILNLLGELLCLALHAVAVQRREYPGKSPT